MTCSSFTKQQPKQSSCLNNDLYGLLELCPGNLASCLLKVYACGSIAGRFIKSHAEIAAARTAAGKEMAPLLPQDAAFVCLHGQATATFPTASEEARRATKTGAGTWELHSELNGCLGLGQELASQRPRSLCFGKMHLDVARPSSRLPAGPEGFQKYSSKLQGRATSTSNCEEVRSLNNRLRSA